MSRLEIGMRRLIRSLPRRKGVMGVATCDRGLPAMMMALVDLATRKIPMRDIVTQESLENAMLVFAAFGGSTNMLLHIPAVAHAAGLTRPTLDDWTRINKLVPRLVDAQPNGPRNSSTVQVFAAGGVPEVMLHLRQIGLLNLHVMTATGNTLRDNLDWWQQSARRHAIKARLKELDNLNFDEIIMDAGAASQAGLTSTAVFPSGSIAPQGAVVKATSVDPSVIDEDQVYRHTSRARVFVSEKDAIEAIKGQSDPPIQSEDIIVLIGCGPTGTGMEETYQLTSALKYIPWGSTCP